MEARLYTSYSDKTLIADLGGSISSGKFGSRIQARRLIGLIEERNGTVVENYPCVGPNFDIHNVVQSGSRRHYYGGYCTVDIDVDHPVRAAYVGELGGELASETVERSCGTELGCGHRSGSRLRCGRGRHWSGWS